KKFLKEEIKTMLAENIIRPSNSPWTSSVKLNTITIRHNYSLPRVDKLLDSLNGLSWFTTLDLTKHYQIQCNALRPYECSSNFPKADGQNLWRHPWEI
ncbi:2258_t:CDS:2, partial [Dentiscutata heterogama]